MTEIIVLGILVASFCWVIWATHGVRPPSDDVDSRDAAVAIWQERAEQLKRRRDQMTEVEYQSELDRIRAGILADAGAQQSRRSQGPALAG